MNEAELSGSGKALNRRRWAPFVAIGALIAVVGTGGWAAYRMLDPVQEAFRGNIMCFNTENVGDRSGIITTAPIVVKDGQSLDVRSISMVDGSNLKLAGSGIQDRVASIGGLEYPAVDDGSAESAGWRSRVELPAPLGNGPTEALIFAVEPVDQAEESSMQALRVDYRNSWGLPYSINVGPVIMAQPECSLGDDEE